MSDELLNPSTVNPSLSVAQEPSLLARLDALSYDPLAREAAARIRALEERLTAPPVQRGTTHWEDCWKDRGHHACAVAAVKRLQSDLAAARADALMSEIERAARDLPNGFSIQIAVENGSAWVELHNADCEEVDFCRDDRTLTEQVTEAIDAALSPTVSEGAGEGI